MGKEKEIDLLELAGLIWDKKKTIFKITLVFALLGLVIAFTGKIEYESYCTLMLESRGSTKGNLGGLSGLAGLAGINLEIGGSSSTISPQLYPSIVYSTNFQLALLQTPIYFKSIDSTISSKQYFEEVSKPSPTDLIKDYTIGLPARIKSLFREESDGGALETDSSFIVLSREEWNMIDSFKERFNVSINEETNVISITSEMPDKYAAAAVLSELVKKLTKSVTIYYTEKAQRDLDFLEAQYSIAEQNYLSAQKDLASFTDKNRNIITSYGNIELQQLQNQFNLTFEIYKNLRAQLEQAKIKLSEESPLFSVIEDINVPIEKSRPRRALILAISIVLGGVFSSIYVLVRSGILLVNS